MTFTIDRAEWMSRAEMEAGTAALPTNPRYDSLLPSDDMRARIIKERHAALHDADLAQPWSSRFSQPSTPTANHNSGPQS